ncbi:MAG: hypothetical protein OXN17_20320 [Candidatus Poribacteria bacterium]|nr:hypothetical protein [Candidatus Poribacteria bacterium]MDE0503189.1 hypothetical protein [Candidatus Poribacteria bacterium]
MENKRISVLSFARDFVLVDFIFFLIVVIGYAVIVGGHEIAAGRENPVETLIAIVGHISNYIPVAIVLTLMFEIGGSLTMLLWRLYKRQIDAQIEQARTEGIASGEAKGEARGEARGIAEAFQLWTAWNNRRLEAEGKNLPFNEPPPPPPQAPSAE